MHNKLPKLFALLLITFSSFISFSQCVNIDLGPNLVLCNNTNTTLTPTITGTLSSNTSFNWSYQNNLISNDTNLVLGSNTTGIYYLQIYDSINLCSHIDSITLFNLSPGIIGDNQISCLNIYDTLFNLTSASTGGSFSISYTWESSVDNINWTPISGATTEYFLPNNLTQSTYYRRVAHTGGCSAPSNEVLIDVITPFTVDVGSDIFVCAGNDVNQSTITTGLSGGFSVQYQWIGPSDTISAANLNFQNTSVSLGGDYTLTASVDNCIVTDTLTLDVYSPIITSPLFDQSHPNLIKNCVSVGATNGLIGLTVNLPQPYSNVNLVTIDWGDGSLDTIPQANFGIFISHTYTLGSFQISVEVEHNSGCTAQVEYDVFVGSSPSPATLALFNNQAEGCTPHFTQYTFNVPSTNVDGTTYEVNWGDGSPSVIYTHPNVPATLSHTFTTTSCGNSVSISGVTYNNVYQPSVITTNPCSQDQPSAAGLISVGEAPIASFTISDTLVCPNSTISILNTSDNGYSINPGSTSCDTVSKFYWVITANNPTNNNTWNIISGSLGSNNTQPNNSLFWTSGTDNVDINFSNPGTYSIELILDNNCGNSSVIKNICIIEPPQAIIQSNDTTGCSPLMINFSENSISPSCNGSSLPVSYNWQVIQNSTPYIISQQNNATTNISFINNSSNVQSYLVVLTVLPLHPVTLAPISNGECISKDTFLVEVFPIPQFTHPTDFYLCNGDDLNALLSTNVASNFTWVAQNQTNVLGETTSLQNSNPIIESLTNTTANVEVVTYDITANSQIGGCTNTSSINIHVVPELVVSPLGSDSICIGGSPSSFTVNYTGGNGTPNYQWLVNGNTISNATNNTYSPGTLNTVGQYTYTVNVTTFGTGCNSNGNATGSVQVLPDPIITNQPIDNNYCLNTATPDTLSVSASGGYGNYTYQWYSNTTSSTTGGTLINGATDSIYIPAVSQIGTTYYYCIVSQTGSNCEATSNTAQININPAPVFNQQPLPFQEFCIGANIPAFTVSYSNGTGIPSYQWYQNTTNSYVNATLIPNATQSTYFPTIYSIDTLFYFCKISFSGGGCSEITSQIGEIILHPDPIINQNLLEDTLCIGGNLNTPLIVSYNYGFGTPSYQWALNNTNITNATNNNFSTSSSNFSNSGTQVFSVSLNLNGIGCDVAQSNIAIIEVIDDPVIITQPQSSSYCQNAPSPLPLSVGAQGGYGNYTYQWYSNTTSSTTGGTLINGATDSTFSPSVQQIGTSYYYCVVTASGSGCQTISNSAEITINPAPNFTLQPTLSQEICIGANFNPIQVQYTNGTGIASFQWYENNIDANYGGTILLNDTNSIYTPQLNTVDTLYYYCIISFSTGGCSEIVSNTAQVIVHPQAIIDVQPLAFDSICVGGSINNPLTVSYTQGVGNPSYQW
ncbi:hypothetical protein SAMN05216474_3160, partial [Lishizhenia tianjinensis]